MCEKSDDLKTAQSPITMTQMIQYSFLFIWQNNKKVSIWKESTLTVRKYKNRDKTILTAVLIYFLFFSPNGKNYISLDQQIITIIIIIWVVYLKEIFNTGFKDPCSAPSCNLQLPISSWSSNVHSSVFKSTPPPFPPYISNRYLNNPPSKPSSLFLVQRSQH